MQSSSNCTHMHAHAHPTTPLRADLCRTCATESAAEPQTNYTTTQWLICPMKNEQAGLQSAHCAPHNVSTSSYSLSVCPFSHYVAFPFALFITLYSIFSSFCVLLLLSFLPLSFLWELIRFPNFFFSCSAPGSFYRIYII